MNEQILINVTPQETRVAVTEQGAVQELHIERDSSRGLVGNVYLGRVCRVLPGMQSAFIEIGLPRAAFLQRGLAPHSPTFRRSRYSITRRSPLVWRTTKRPPLPQPTWRRIAR